MSPALPKLVRAGGLGRAALRQALRAERVRLNRAAEALFEDPRFEPSAEEQALETRAFAVHELGLARGGTYRDVVERARALGFVECPLELGPHSRLQYRDQEGARVGSRGAWRSVWRDHVQPMSRTAPWRS